MMVSMYAVVPTSKTEHPSWNQGKTGIHNSGIPCTILPERFCSFEKSLSYRTEVDATIQSWCSSVKTNQCIRKAKIGFAVMGPTSGGGKIRANTLKGTPGTVGGPPIWKEVAVGVPPIWKEVAVGGPPIWKEVAVGGPPIWKEVAVVEYTCGKMERTLLKGKPGVTNQSGASTFFLILSLAADVLAGHTT